MITLVFPVKGVNRGVASILQPTGTSPDLLNVRPFDTLGNRLRGGQRPGLKKWGSGVQIGSSEQPVVAICTVSSVE